MPRKVTKLASSTTKKVVAAPTQVVGGVTGGVTTITSDVVDSVGSLSAAFSEAKNAVKYNPEIVKYKSKQVIHAFGLPSNTPMKIRLIAPCMGYNEEKKAYEHGELIITRKNVAFLSQSEPRAMRRSEIQATREGKKAGDPQLTIVSITGNNLKLNQLSKIDKTRAIKIIGHLIKQKEDEKRGLKGSLFGRRKKSEDVESSHGFGDEGYESEESDDILSPRDAIDNSLDTTFTDELLLAEQGNDPELNKSLLDDASDEPVNTNDFSLEEVKLRKRKKKKRAPTDQQRENNDASKNDDAHSKNAETNLEDNNNNNSVVVPVVSNSEDTSDKKSKNQESDKKPSTSDKIDTSDKLKEISRESTNSEKDESSEMSADKRSLKDSELEERNKREAVKSTADDGKEIRTPRGLEMEQKKASSIVTAVPVVAKKANEDEDDDEEDEESEEEEEVIPEGKDADYFLHSDDSGEEDFDDDEDDEDDAQLKLKAAKSAEQDRKLKEEEANKAKLAALKAEEEKIAKEEEERKAKEEAQRRAEEERKAKEEADRKAEEARLAEAAALKAEADRKAKEEEERIIKEEADRKAEEERKAKEEADRKAEEERKAKEDEEKKRKEDEAKKAEEERKTKELEAKKAEEAAIKLEQERKIKEQEEQKAKEEAQRKAEEERKAKEEADRKAEEARLAEAAALKAEADRKAKEEADRKAQEEADRKAEAERKAKEDADRKAEAARLAKEEDERKAKEEADRKAKEDADRKAKEEADRLAKEEAARRAEEERLAAIARRGEEGVISEEGSRQAGEFAVSGIFRNAQLLPNSGISEHDQTFSELLNWARKLGNGEEINNFKTSFNDGVALNSIVKSIDGKVNLPDSTSLDAKNKKQNLEKVFDETEKQLHVSLPRSLSVDKLINETADENDIVTYNLDLFSKYLDLNPINENSKYSSSDLLDWVKKTTAGYDHVKIEDFNSSFNDGMAFCALIHAIAPNALDYSSLHPNESEKNLNHALQVAEKRLGIKKPSGEFAKALLNHSASPDAVASYTAKYLEKYLRTQLENARGISECETDVLLEWAKIQTAPYDRVKIVSYDEGFDNGLAFAALLDSIKPGSIDVASLNPANKEENLTLALSVAKESFGISTDINAADLAAGNDDEAGIRAFLSDLRNKVRRGVYAKRSFTSNRPSKTNDPVQLDDELLKWTQNQTHGYSGVDVQRFDCNSFGDGLAFAALLDSIQPGCMQFASIDPENKKENLTKAFEAAQKLLGVSSVLNIDDLISGRCSDSNIRSYVSEIREKLFALPVVSVVNENDELLDWVQDQTKGYSGVDVKNFDSSFENGLAFAAILDSVRPGCLEYAKLDANNKKENLLQSFDVAEKQLQVPKTLNAAVVASGKCDSDTIRAYVSAIRDQSLQKAVIVNRDADLDDELLKWTQNQTHGYSGVDIKRFDCNSFGDGLAFAALLDSIQPGCMQFASIDPENKKENLTKAFEVAQKLLGVSSALNVDDLISGACGESDIRAFVAEIQEKSLNFSSVSDEDDELLGWVQDQTKGYSGVDVKNFDSSFENGLAFAAILDSVQPGCLEYAKLNANNKKENLLQSFDVAEKQLQVPKTLNAAVVASGKCDSGNVRAYVSKIREQSLQKAVIVNRDADLDDELLKWLKIKLVVTVVLMFNDLIAILSETDLLLLLYWILFNLDACNSLPLIQKTKKKLLQKHLKLLKNYLEFHLL